jgi:uncharacterized repeat protein (TIGR02543 family)
MRDFSVISDNHAPISFGAQGNGGGVHLNSNATMLMSGNSSVRNNFARTGGGIYAGISASINTVTLTNNASVSANTATSYSGAGNGYGGGIAIINGDLNLSNYVTIANNRAIDGVGGGIYGNYSTITINDNVTIFHNSSTVGGGGLGIITNGVSKVAMIELNGGSIIDNYAPEGGAIASYSTYDLNFATIDYSRINIAANANVIFNANTADELTQLNDPDKISGLGNWVYSNDNAVAEISVPALTVINGVTDRQSDGRNLSAFNNYDIIYHGAPLALITVDFDSNGGSSVPSQVVNTGGLLVQPPNPTRDCDIFDGWFTDPELTIPWSFSDPVESGMTLYARWTPNECATSYKVSFDSNGGTEIPEQEVNAGDLLIPPANPARNCDIFDGWFTDSELTIPWNFGDPVNVDITLYARWISRDCPIPPRPPCPPCPPLPTPVCRSPQLCAVLCRPQCFYPPCPQTPIDLSCFHSQLLNMCRKCV